MANKQRPTIVPLPYISHGLNPICPPPEEEPDPEDKEEQMRDAIQLEVNKFYEVLENPRRRDMMYFRCPICRGSSRTKLLKGMTSLIQHAQTVISPELQIHWAFGHHFSGYINYWGWRMEEDSAGVGFCALFM